MCGIAGIVERKGGRPDEEALRAMTRVLAHRGPDGEGFHIDGPVGFGHRRLSIIDLAEGQQPMADADGEIWVTFNGEIYNYVELREELQAHGHRFRTQSDTEVLLYAYKQYGAGFLRKLNGMFALGLWDGRNRQLILARDPLGVKPLVFAVSEERLLFASEIKALLQHPGLDRRADPAGIADFLSYRVVRAPRTAFQGIERLAPGEALTWEPGEPLRRFTYWRLPEDHFTGRDIDSLTEELDALLSDSVRMQLRSDVPVGAFLSGGVDSSAIVWHMAKQGVTPRTFTVAFGKSNESAFNEGAFARDVASVVGAEHSELVLDHFELARILERILWFLDEPCATAIPNYFVSQAARSRVTVALSGIGGDELFAGYARYNPIFSYLDPRESVAAYARRFVASQTNFDAHGLRAMLAPEALAVVQAAKRTAVEENAVKHGSKLRAGMQIDVENYLGNDLLPFMDNMSMAHSLEVRVPLLDYRIAEFAARLPDEAKVLRGIRKYLLKRTLADRVPNHVLTREKKGFRLPLQVWLRELKPFVYATLDLARVRRQGLVNPAAVEQALRAYYEAPAPGWGVTYRLWSLLILQLWVERFLEAKPPGTPPEAASKWVVAA